MTALPVHEHDYERGSHMRHAFGVDGRRFACAICGEYRPYPVDTRPRCVQCGALVARNPGAYYQATDSWTCGDCHYADFG